MAFTQFISYALDFIPSHSAFVHFILLAFIVRYICAEFRKCQLMPPGPVGLPFVGYLPFVGSEAHLTFHKLAKKYGNIFSLKMGSVDLVILNGWSSVKEALSKDEFLGKPKEMIFSAVMPLTTLADLDGNLWKEQKRFMLTAFKYLGIGRTAMENVIMDEIRCIFAEIDSRNGCEVDCRTLFFNSTSNTLCQLVCGKRYDYKDPVKLNLQTALGNNQDYPMVGLLSFFPKLTQFCAKWNLFRFGEFRAKTTKVVDDFAMKSIKSHLDTYDRNVTRDFIDCFIEKMMENDGNKQTSFTKEILRGSVFSFFGTGSDTTAITLEWALLLLVTHDRVLCNLQEEIDSVVGNYREVTWADRVLMPYTQAVMMEVHRWATIIPINFPRQTLCDTSVGGIFIPKNTQIMVNFWSVHRDPTIFANAEIFDPNRFLSSDNNNNKQTVVKNKAVIPFSYGKRTCPGEFLSNLEFFLVLVTVIQKYKFQHPQGTNVTLDDVFGFTRNPKQPLTLCFEKRIY